MIKEVTPRSRGVLFTSNLEMLHTVLILSLCTESSIVIAYSLSSSFFFVFHAYLQECKHVHSDNTYYIQIVDLR